MNEFEDENLIDKVEFEPVFDTPIGRFSLVDDEEEIKDEDRPEFSSEEWPAWVMTHFNEDELVDGNPTTDGLRRVVEKVLGPILYSKAIVYQSPSCLNGFHACVGHEVTILWMHPDPGMAEHERVFSDVADVYKGNLPDERFARFASATAATRAEGRALRKALRLKRVIAAEEASSIPIEDAGLDNKITKSQISFINTICSRINVNVNKFLESRGFSNIEDIYLKEAILIEERLSEWQGNLKSIPKELIGYDKNWRKNG
jgi:hypothetical protein